MTTGQHPTIINAVISGAIALAVWVGGAIPAGAEPNGASAGPAPDDAKQRDEVERGIRDGLSAWMPRLPPPLT